jgi:EAL domain-containing protein (putative c-di-GMP-specific phosphodiesterase class I)
VTDGGRNAAVARAIISLGQNLELKVIAEGVETAGQVSFLRENNCDEIQGYHVSAPLSADDFERWLTGWERPGRA